MYKRGFSLIELLVVIAIMGILATIVVGGLQGAKAVSRDAKRISDIKNIQLSLALYYNDNGHYPCLIYGTVASASCQPDFSPGYMDVVPRNESGVQYLYASFVSAPGSVNCTAAGRVVESYHLGSPMTSPGSNLTTQDRDATNATYTTECSGSSVQFDGNATNCVGTGAVSPDSCYDVVPNF